MITFKASLTNAFKSLLENEDFVDMTLSAGGKTLRAHKVVLSACSSYFKQLLQGTYGQTCWKWEYLCFIPSSSHTGSKVLSLPACSFVPLSVCLLCLCIYVCPVNILCWYLLQHSAASWITSCNMRLIKFLLYEGETDIFKKKFSIFGKWCDLE